MSLKLESKMGGNEERIKNLENKISELRKKIISTRKTIPGDDAMAKAQDTSLVGSKRKLQFQNKKQAEEAEIKLWNKEISELTKEISLLKKSPQETPEKNTEKNTEKLQTTTENINKKMAKLTKNNILRMVEQSEPARMTKRELIESIQRRLMTEDVSDDVLGQLDSGEHSYKGHLNPETVKNISREMINKVSSDLSNKMGGARPSLRLATNALQQGLMGAIEKEEGHRRELERLAVKMVKEEYDIPEGMIDFDVEITGQNPVSVGDIPLRKVNKPIPQGKTEEELKPKITKRKLENALIQGAGRAGQNMFYQVSDELNRINPGLVQDYAKLMSANNFMYWALNDEQIMDASGQKAGEFEISFREETPKITAKGMTFSLLLHELNKAVVEYLSVDSQDPDRSVRDYVKGQTDNLEEETWDIRLGHIIWDKLLESLGVDALSYKANILVKIFDLPETQFNKVVEGMLNGDSESLEVIQDIAYDVIQMKNQDAVEDALSQFRDKDTEDEEEDVDTLAGGDEKGEDEFLKNILSKQEKEDSSDPMSWDYKKLDSERDIALDKGDYKKVAFIQTVIDQKFPGK
jgi:hypothetical protein